MDFFERQDVARRKSGRLVVLFVLGVVGVVVAMNLAVAVVLTFFPVMTFMRDREAIRTGVAPPKVRVDATPATLWKHTPQVFLFTTLGTLGVILVGALYKWASLASGGGAKVAELLGGRPVTSGSRGADDRVLLDVVEEMAIASGCRVPAVYVLDGEDGINAFAAGLRQEDAVIGVTRGAIDRLTRDELQGVIAHEFSHVLNRDMTLNLKLMAMLHGIMAVAMCGYVMVRMIAEGGGRAVSRSSSRNNKGGGAAVILALVVLGVAMIVVGYVGVFFGRLIQAAVSRQREFLADSAAVQFTRNPRGLAGALARLMSPGSPGTVVHSAQAREAAHLMFGSVHTWNLTRLTDTHPPLEARIEAIAPGFLAERSGKLARAGVGEENRQPAPRPRKPAQGTLDRIPLADLASAVVAPPKVDGPRLAAAGLFLSEIPVSLRSAARDPFSARALTLAVIFGAGNAETRRHAAEAVARVLGNDGTIAEAVRLLPEVVAAGPAARMSLLDLALPALRGLEPRQAAALHKAVSAAVWADDDLTLFEYCLVQVVGRALTRAEGKGKAPARGAASVLAVAAEARAVIAVVARADGRRGRPAREAFAAGLSRLGLGAPGEPADEPPAGDVVLLDRAIAALAAAAIGVRARVLEAAAYAVALDETVGVEEGEVIRALGAALDIAVPPYLRLAPAGG